MVGFNDLLSNNPHIANEWDYEKNKGLFPGEVTTGSGKMVWWKCEIGHEWQAPICKRTIRGDGCPKCSKELRTSFPEQAIFYYISQVYTDAINGDKSAVGKEIDVYIPSLKVGIEYDGMPWHKDEYKDIIKNNICLEKGIELYRIRDDRCPVLPVVSNVHIISCNNSKNSIEDALCKLFDEMSISADINLERDNIHILSQYIKIRKAKSLSTVYPELAKEWNYDKNNGIMPAQVLVGSTKKVWWKCEIGHEWQATIVGRTGRNAGCPYCSSNRVFVGFNDLATHNPEIAKEWNEEKNDDLKPTEVTSKSSKKVWWKCDKGHEWQATIASRTGLKASCPYCYGLKALKGINDLSSNYPEMVKEWNYDRNDNLKPTEVTSKSGKKVWWKCDKGHEWQATIASRTGRNTGCPYCSGHRILSGYNDLTTKYPEIAKEWNEEKNDSLKPTEVTSKSSKKVWWKCVNGHEWQATVASRTGRNTGCPFCSDNRVLSGFNDLATKYPEIAKEWNYEKNKGVDPNQVTYGSGKKVWWKCIRGHEWNTSICKRTLRGDGCPYCSGHRVLSGFKI